MASKRRVIVTTTSKGFGESDSAFFVALNRNCPKRTEENMMNSAEDNIVPSGSSSVLRTLEYHNGNHCGLYCGGARFEYWPRHRQYGLGFRSSQSLSKQFYDGTEN